MAFRRTTRRGFGGARGAKRPTFWAAVNSTAWQTIVDGTIADNAAITTIVSEAELDNVPNPTVVRIRGHVWQTQNEEWASEDEYMVAHCIQVVDAKQLAVGSTGLPLPLDDNSEDFLWYESTVIGQSATLAGSNTGTRDGFDIVVDSKAMRKITINQALVLVTQIDALQTVAVRSIKFALNLRILLKK